MSIKDLTITDQNVQSTYVQSQPDRLTGTAQQNKAAFDAYPELIRQRFNQLLEALTGTGGAGEIPIGPIEGVTAENVQQALEAIQQNLTAYINKIKAATGAAEVGISAISGMQAQNVQKALEELRIAIDNIVSGIIPGGSITADMIEDGAIVQLGALLAIAAAAAYDPEGSYAVGDYCTKEGVLQKCNTNIKDGEEWNAEHWTETTVAEELTKVKISLSNKMEIPSALNIDTDLNIVKSPGFYFCNGAENENRPDDSGSFSLLVEKTGSWEGKGVKQTYTGYSTGITYTRVFQGYDDTIWEDWKQLSIATSPQVRNLTLQSGFAANIDCAFFLMQESTVFLTGGVSGTMPANQDTQIGTLPADACPTAQRRRPATTNAGVAYIDIHTDGTVWVHPFAASSMCWFDASFVAGGGS